jgi:hypothetical protein
MGLENGIILSCPDKYNTKILNTILDTEPCDKSKEICYWKKCQGLRDDILTYLKFVYPDRKDYCTLYLSSIDIFNIRQIIMSWQDKKKWNLEGNSIWSYKDIKKKLRTDVERLTFILGMLETIDKEEKNKFKIYFYDSY